MNTNSVSRGPASQTSRGASSRSAPAPQNTPAEAGVDDRAPGGSDAASRALQRSSTMQGTAGFSSFTGQTTNRL